MHLTYRSTKTYGHNLGLSCCFRQWRASSHCRHLHGYSVSVRFEFEADDLDANNWVVDFGSLKPLKAWLEAQLDHKTLVATDDPERAWFEEAARRGIVDVVWVGATGCERFAEMIFRHTEEWLAASGYAPRVRLAKVEFMEHGANSAIVTGAAS